MKVISETNVSMQSIDNEKVTNNKQNMHPETWA